MVGYASTVWHDPLRDKTHLRHLNTAQRTSLIRIFSPFKTVATTTLEVEALFFPPTVSATEPKTPSKVSTLYPENTHLERPVASPETQEQYWVILPLPTGGSIEDHEPERLNDLETIDPRPLPPWRTEPFTEIEIEPDRETARDRAGTIRSTSDIIIYSDASGREGYLGAAAVALNDSLEITESQQVQVSPIDRWSVHVAELIGIFYAISLRHHLKE